MLSRPERLSRAGLAFEVALRAPDAGDERRIVFRLREMQTGERRIDQFGLSPAALKITTTPASATAWSTGSLEAAVAALHLQGWREAPVPAILDDLLWVGDGQGTLPRWLIEPERYEIRTPAVIAEAIGGGARAGQVRFHPTSGGLLLADYAGASGVGLRGLLLPTGLRFEHRVDPTIRLAEQLAVADTGAELAGAAVRVDVVHAAVGAELWVADLACLDNVPLTLPLVERLLAVDALVTPGLRVGECRVHQLLGEDEVAALPAGVRDGGYPYGVTLTARDPDAPVETAPPAWSPGWTPR